MIGYIVREEKQLKRLHYERKLRRERADIVRGETAGIVRER